MRQLCFIAKDDERYEIKPKLKGKRSILGMVVVETNKGKISGLELEDCVLFKGIPYAKPPIGELRWRPPQQAEAFQQVYCADYYAPRCMQCDADPDSFYMKEFQYDAPMSEDCLYLNIWMPMGAKPGDNLPVAFWIHGGAFMTGYSYEMEYDGAAYCARGIILVTIAYRCNIFGFFAHQWLCEEDLQKGGKGISGNYGMLDQIAALKWVHENIAAFGGDRNNITVFGQSAGARSAQLLMSTPLTGRMVAKAILQSSANYGAHISRDMTLEQAKAIGNRFVASTGANSLQELRHIPAKKLVQQANCFVGKIKSLDDFILVPIIDDYCWTAASDTLIEQGKVRNIPCIIGSTENDITATPSQVVAGGLSPLQQGCVDWSLKLEEIGHQPSYVYYFRHKPLGDDAGAFHSADLWYMFGTLERSWRPKNAKDYELSYEMLEYWTNFMKTGDPNGDGLERWNRYTKKCPQFKEFW